jgi:hypothetical protein
MVAVGSSDATPPSTPTPDLAVCLIPNLLDLNPVCAILTDLVLVRLQWRLQPKSFFCMFIKLQRHELQMESYFLQVHLDVMVSIANEILLFCNFIWLK